MSLKPRLQDGAAVVHVPNILLFIVLVLSFSNFISVPNFKSVRLLKVNEIQCIEFETNKLFKFVSTHIVNKILIKMYRLPF